MSMDGKIQCLISGDFACFTRPELKAERVSYDFPTPSACIGILEAIHWKPEFRFEIDTISILKPIKHYGLKRNEIRTLQGVGRKPLYIEEDRTQRYSLILKDVAYVIEASIIPTTPNPHHTLILKHKTIFEQRLKKGKCFKTPYLGCREFIASFLPITEKHTPIILTDDFGVIFHSMDYNTMKPIFFNVKVINGVIDCRKGLIV